MLRTFVGLMLAATVSAPQAQEPPKLTTQEVDLALASLKRWRGFEGTWEGEVRYVAAPKEDWKRQVQPLRVVFKNGQPKVFVRHGIRHWSALGTTFQVRQPDELTIILHAYGASGVWTENNLVVLTRRTEDVAEVFVQRVVNNWAGRPLPGEDLIYGDTRAGQLRRQ